MVNLVDCVRNVAADRYAMIKILILAIPYMLAIYSKIDVMQLSLSIIFGVIFLAVFFETIRRSCNAEPMLLPSFLMPVRMFLTFGLTIIASIPSLAILYGLSFGITELFKVYPQLVEVKTTYYVIAVIANLLGISLFFASVTQFLDTGKVLNAYNPIKVLRALKTFIVNLIFFVIQDIIFLGIFVVIPIIIIYFLANQDVFNFFLMLYLTMGLIFNYLAFADYIGQTKKDSESPYERLF